MGRLEILAAAQAVLVAVAVVDMEPQEGQEHHLKATMEVTLVIVVVVTGLFMVVVVVAVLEREEVLRLGYQAKVILLREAAAKVFFPILLVLQFNEAVAVVAALRPQPQVSPKQTQQGLVEQVVAAMEEEA